MVKQLAATEEYAHSKSLIKAISNRFPTPLPKHYIYFAWTIATLSSFIFYLGPFLLFCPIILSMTASPRVAASSFIVIMLLELWPLKEWPWARGIFQCFYDIFNFHHNILAEKAIELYHNKLSIVCMHPHGVIPIQAYLWSAVCDQYMTDLYGFGATTDFALRVPLLRNLLGYLNAGSASRHVLFKKLEEGVGLFLLPGGVAEVFLAERGTHRIKARRYGLMKIALQSGACLIPTYVFGGTDFFDNLATYGRNQNDGEKYVIGKILERVSRSMKGGLTLFWGQYGLPIPYAVQKLSMVMGDPIWPDPKTIGKDSVKNKDGKEILTCKKVPNPTNEQIEQLLHRYLDALQRLFDQYKAQAGYPNAKLEIS